MALTSVDFDYVRNLVRDRSAIVLEPGKEYLVESRLEELIRREGIESIAKLVTELRAKTFSHLHELVVDAMTTNETSFFRDGPLFRAIQTEVVPDIISKNQGSKTIRTWCAASSSGQEPYSLSMMLCDKFPELSSWNVEIMATDISDEMLNKAKSGTYTQLEVNRGLPAPLLVKFFKKNGLQWTLNDRVRNMVNYRKLNLAENWPIHQKFDMIFIRNVLIYFDVQMKKSILQRAANLLSPNGYLFLGTAETMISLDSCFDRVQLGTSAGYKLRGS